MYNFVLDITCLSQVCVYFLLLFFFLENYKNNVVLGNGKILNGDLKQIWVQFKVIVLLVSCI